LDFLDSGLFILEVALLLVFSLLGETASTGEVGFEESSCLFSLGETVPSSWMVTGIVLSYSRLPLVPPKFLLDNSLFFEPLLTPLRDLLPLLKFWLAMKCDQDFGVSWIY